MPTLPTLWSSDVLHTIDLLNELNIKQQSVPIYEDNQAVITMMTNEINFQTKSKHVRVRYDFLREQVAASILTFRYLSTELQLADLMTKPLIGEKFHYVRDCLMGVVAHKPYSDVGAHLLNGEGCVRK